MNEQKRPAPPPRALELDAIELRSLVDRVTTRIATHLERLPHRPVVDERATEETATRLAKAIPESGRPVDEVLDEIFDVALACGYDTASPGYLAYIPGGGLLQSAVADLVSGAVNRYSGVWVAAPGPATIENAVLRWLCDLVGYPPGSLGLLTTGGSMANLIALVTARSELLGEDLSRGVAYFSDQAHHSLIRAARLAGIGAGRVRILPTDDRFAMRADLLAGAIERDLASGLSPFFVGATAGTTNTGSVDPIGDLAAVARSAGAWLHVDAAYGGFFLLTERGREAMPGLEAADSIVLDPHKGMFLPYGNGSLLVRDGSSLRRTHSVHADYMPAMQSDPSRVDFCDVSPELSRDWRGLRLWLPLMLHGVSAFRALLDEKLDLARYACARVAAMPGMKIVSPPKLSLFTFRFERSACSSDDVDALNRRLLERVNRRGRVFMTGTTLRDRFIPRMCVLHFRTHGDRIEMGLEDLAAAAAEI